MDGNGVAEMKRCDQTGSLFRHFNARIRIETEVSEPQDIPYMDSGRFDLNINAKYASWIDGFNSVRELVQNWFDRTLETLGGGPTSLHDEQFGNVRLAFHKRNENCTSYILEQDLPQGQRYIQLTNFFTCLHRDALTMGYSRKASKAAAGAYGEGMKVEINRLVARGVKVEVFTGNTHWLFTHETEEGRTEKKLFLHSRGTSQNCKHLSICLLVPAGVQLEFDRRNFLFLQQPVKRYGDEMLEVLLDDEHSGRVYARGIFVMEDSELEGFGFNFLGSVEHHKAFSLSRDRDHMSTSSLVSWLPVLVQHLQQKDRQSCEIVISHLYNTLERQTGRVYDNLHSAWQTLQILIAVRRDPFSVKPVENLADLMVKMFHMKNHHVSSPYPVDANESHGSQEEAEAAYLCCTSIKVPTRLYKLLKLSQDCPDVERIWQQRARDISTLQDWEAPNPTAKSIASKFLALGRLWFDEALGSAELKFKCFPHGNERLVVSGRTPDNVLFYAIDMVLLEDSGKTHSWIAKQGLGNAARCIDPKGTNSCSGTCTMYRYSEELKLCLQRHRPGMKSKLDQMQKIAMMRIQMSELGAVQEVPVPNVIQSTPQEAFSSVARCPSPDETGSESDSLDGQTMPNLGVPQQRRGVASEVTNTFQDLLRSCLNPAARLSGFKTPPDGLFHSGVAPKFGLIHAKLCDGNSAMNLVQLQEHEHKLFFKPLLPLYHEGRNIDEVKHLGCDVSRAVQMNDFAKLVYWLSTQVFQIPTPFQSVRVFWEDAERIAFNRDGELFFNARFAVALNQSMSLLRQAHYWYVIFCHELAHNHAGGHNKDHEQAEETLIFSFLGSLQDSCAKAGLK